MMRINKKIYVEKDFEEGLCSYRLPSEENVVTLDVLDGPYSGLSRLFPAQGEYIVKVDVIPEQFSPTQLRPAIKYSDQLEYEGTRMVRSDIFVVYRSAEIKRAYVLQSINNPPFRCTIWKEHVLYKLIPYVGIKKYREIKISVREDLGYSFDKSPCPCRKQSFDSWKDAKIAARVDTPREKMKAIYKCNVCGKWHLTTKDGVNVRKSKDGGYNRQKEKKILRSVMDGIKRDSWKDAEEEGKRKSYWRVRLKGILRDGH